VLGVLVGLAVVTIGVLLYYYRPSIEYAYVDIRGRPVSGWAVTAGVLATLAVVAIPIRWGCFGVSADLLHYG